MQSYLIHLSKTDNLLLIHNTFSSNEDIIWANDLHKKLYWCLCPNANLYIENKLSDVNLLIKNIAIKNRCARNDAGNSKTFDFIFINS